MRTIIGAIAVVLGLAAQPAFAGVGAVPAGAAPAPLLTTATATAAPALIAAVPLLTLVPAAVAVDAALAPGDAFRLEPVTLAATAPATSIVTTVLAGGLRHRFTGNMIEFYPVAGSGFHLSGGSRLFARRNFAAETENSAHGALAVTRITTQSAVTRAGFKRFNSAATAGYTMPLSSMAQIGVEAGAMMSHAFANAPGLPRHGAGYRSDTAFHPDAIANLVFGMHF
jgi:hypothetical protein